MMNQMSGFIIALFLFYFVGLWSKTRKKTIRMLTAKGIHHNHVIENKGVRKKWTFFFLHFAHVKMNVKHASLSGKAPAMNFLWGFFFLSQCTMDPFYPVFWSFFFDSYSEVLSGIRCCFSLTRLHDHFVFGECTAPYKLNKAKYRAFWPNNRTHTCIYTTESKEYIHKISITRTMMH